MRIKRKNGLKMIVIALVLLLCLALAVGITGAYYQAKRQATGTLNMDQGIIIDYKGFGQTPNEGIWLRDTTTKFLLFSETNAQPGEHIAVNAAGIRANTKSVDFYARVKLEYKFYNNGTEVTTLPATGSLITTSANFFGANWVDGGSSNGYYYYATGTTLNKFNKGTQTFVDLFATGAEFIIEGEHFTGATSNGEGGGFVVGDTSINKIEVYLTLETLQGDATAEQAKALGWKIEPPIVDFSKIKNNSDIVNSINSDVKMNNEKLNVTINGTTTELDKVTFPYGEETILEFDSKNVDYITLKYSNGDTETFGAKADDFANAYDENTKLKVTANSSKGKVTAYIVGLFGDSEYKDFIYSAINSNDLSEGLILTGYRGTAQNGELTISGTAKVRTRDFKEVYGSESYTDFSTFDDLINTIYASLSYPMTIDGYEAEIVDEDAFMVWYETLNEETFNAKYKDQLVIRSKKLVIASVLGTSCPVKEIGQYALHGCSSITNLTIGEGIVKIGAGAFGRLDGSDKYEPMIENVSLPKSLTTIEQFAFGWCNNLKTITFAENNMLETIGRNCFIRCDVLTTEISAIGGTWVLASDGSTLTYTKLNQIQDAIKKNS